MSRMWVHREGWAVNAGEKTRGVLPFSGLAAMRGPGMETN